MGQKEGLVAQISMVWNKQSGAMEQQVVLQTPRGAQLPIPNSVHKLLCVCSYRDRSADVIQEGEGGPERGE